VARCRRSGRHELKGAPGLHHRPPGRATANTPLGQPARAFGPVETGRAEQPSAARAPRARRHGAPTKCVERRLDDGEPAARGAEAQGVDGLHGRDDAAADRGQVRDLHPPATARGADAQAPDGVADPRPPGPARGREAAARPRRLAVAGARQRARAPPGGARPEGARGPAHRDWSAKYPRRRRGARPRAPRRSRT